MENQKPGPSTMKSHYRTNVPRGEDGSRQQSYRSFLRDAAKGKMPGFGSVGDDLIKMAKATLKRKKMKP